jgi:hypothetical protein
VNANLCTPAKVEQAVATQSTVHHGGTYVVPATVDIDCLISLTPFKTGVLNKEAERKHELSYFGYVAQWKSFRDAVISRRFFLHQDTSLPMQLFFFPRFTTGDCGHVWMLIKGYIHQLCDETPTDLRMRAPAPTTNFVGLSVTLFDTQR